MSHEDPDVRTDATLDAPAEEGAWADAPSATSARKPAAKLPKGKEASVALDKEELETLRHLEEGEEPHLSFRGMARRIGSFLFSLVFHMALMVVLAFWALPEVARSTLTTLVAEADYEPEEVLETVVLDESTEAATELNFSAQSSDVFAAETPMVTEPSFDASVVETDTEGFSVELDTSLGKLPAGGTLLAGMPDGHVGTRRSVVDGSGQALDRITQEIMWMLDSSKVLVIWLFDESGSMKYSQQEIRDRIGRVYAELGLSDKSAGDALMSSIASYGENFQLQTPRPTNDVAELREAIDRIPTDPSGKERQHQAIIRAIAAHRKYATAGQRKMAMILLTAKSGELEDKQYLEAAVDEAKRARCTIFVLGREAVFGYPYALMRWKHPQTLRIHWIRINRGPETAFVEQLQTNGFYRREDAFPSGFGPYEQSRLAHQTGGIFFMLPSVETNIVRGENRRYELEAMRGYQVDLRSREAIFRDRDTSDLRKVLYTIIIRDLNPWDEQQRKKVEMRRYWSTNFDEFKRQASVELVKAKGYIEYLDAAIKQLEKMRRLRNEEPDMRWRANYDLTYAQLLAFKVRMFEYGAFFEDFCRNPRTAPLTKQAEWLGKRQTVTMQHWRLTTRKSTLTDAITEPTRTRATELLSEVVKNHPGTPWAARAQWEIRRGYGVDVYPYYEGPWREIPKGEKRIPVPKL
ncbi:MAG: hypothetical protein RBS80_21735 [Thermoguttaceae bacterium]|jgi:hypothetical protein|nr:hypothetical protein [Thermoguttaceae bacterium]